MRNVKRASIIGLRLLACCLLSSSLVGAQESTNYRMDRLTVAATADTATSASYAMMSSYVNHSTPNPPRTHPSHLE